MKFVYVLHNLSLFLWVWVCYIFKERVEGMNEVLVLHVATPGLISGIDTAYVPWVNPTRGAWNTSWASWYNTSWALVLASSITRAWFYSQVILTDNLVDCVYLWVSRWFTSQRRSIREQQLGSSNFWPIRTTTYFRNMPYFLLLTTEYLEFMCLSRTVPRTLQPDLKITKTLCSSAASWTGRRIAISL